MDYIDFFQCVKSVMDVRLNLFLQCQSGINKIIADTFDLHCQYEVFFTQDLFVGLRERWESKLEERDRDCHIVLSRMKKIKDGLDNLFEEWKQFESMTIGFSDPYFRQKYATFKRFGRGWERSVMDVNSHLTGMQARWNALDRGLIDELKSTGLC